MLSKCHPFYALHPPKGEREPIASGMCEHPRICPRFSSFFLVVLLPSSLGVPSCRPPSPVSSPHLCDVTLAGLHRLFSFFPYSFSFLLPLRRLLSRTSWCRLFISIATFQVFQWSAAEYIPRVLTDIFWAPCALAGVPCCCTNKRSFPRIAGVARLLPLKGRFRGPAFWCWFSGSSQAWYPEVGLVSAASSRMQRGSVRGYGLGLAVPPGTRCAPNPHVGRRLLKNIDLDGVGTGYHVPKFDPHGPPIVARVVAGLRRIHWCQFFGLACCGRRLAHRSQHRRRFRDHWCPFSGLACFCRRLAHR